MQTNLIGKYATDNYGGCDRQEIMAVYLDRGTLKLVTRTSDGNICSREAEHCKVVDSIS